MVGKSPENLPLTDRSIVATERLPNLRNIGVIAGSIISAPPVALIWIGLDTAIASIRNLDASRVIAGVQQLNIESSLGALASDAGITLTTLVSDVGIAYSLSNFCKSYYPYQDEYIERSRGLAMFTGALGAAGSTLSRTGDPKWIACGFGLGAASSFLAFIDATK